MEGACSLQACCSSVRGTVRTTVHDLPASLCDLSFMPMTIMSTNIINTYKPRGVRPSRRPEGRGLLSRPMSIFCQEPGVSNGSARNFAFNAERPFWRRVLEGFHQYSQDVRQSNTKGNILCVAGVAILPRHLGHVVIVVNRYNQPY